MIDLKRYTQLKGEVDRLKSDSDRASGTLAHLLSRMKEEHGCDSLDKAKTRLERMQAMIDRGEEELSEAVVGFESEWESQLEGEQDGR